jgi:hypothetical protein
MKVYAAPESTPWMWTLAYGHHKDRWPTHGYEATREAAMGRRSPRAVGENRTALSEGTKSPGRR